MCNFQKGAPFPKTALMGLFSKEKIEPADPFYFAARISKGDKCREFLVGQDVASREAMKDRNKTKNVRKYRAASAVTTQKQILTERLRGSGWTCCVWVGNGAGGRNRTADTGIFSPLLYRLSYPGLLFLADIRLDASEVSEISTKALPCQLDSPGPHFT